MKNEVIIRNWLLSWYKPEKVTEFNTPERVREPLVASNFNIFIKVFQDETGRSQFTEDEIELLRGAITGTGDSALAFSDGYPQSVAEAIRANTVYIIEAGWQQLNKAIGANFWDGKAATHIAVVGRTVGDSLNMTEPSLILKMITSLLIAGQGYFTSQHLQNQIINETLYGADEANSHEKGFAMRTLSMSSEAHRYGVITQPRSHLNGQ